MAAEVAARAGAKVAVFDRMPSPSRKLLLAGRGGLNLTHSEDLDRFLGRYGDAAQVLAPSLRRFGPQALRDWCGRLGIETFVGSSGRVFPVSFKTSPLLRAWLRDLDRLGVAFRVRHRWCGWDAHRLRFETPDGDVAVDAEATVLALGGASWPHLGTDGAWVATLRETGCDPAPLQPANCGFCVDWSEHFRQRFEGQPLKAVALSFENRTARGDVVVTRRGLEGGPIYALAPRLRETIATHGSARLQIALRPDLTTEAIATRLAKRRPKESLSTALRRALRLSPVAIGLLREADGPPSNGEGLAARVSALHLRLTAPMPLDRAISTAGGVRFADLDENLMLRSGVFIAGEMLDWEAPTGGYLLQACFATGVTAGEGAAAWARRKTSDDTSPAKVEADVDASRMV